MAKTRVLKQFGDWIVTADGIDTVNGRYFIDKSRLWALNWSHHLSLKNWVVANDFDAALLAAQQIHARHRPGFAKRARLEAEEGV